MHNFSLANTFLIIDSTCNLSTTHALRMVSLKSRYVILAVVVVYKYNHGLQRWLRQSRDHHASMIT